MLTSPLLLGLLLGFRHAADADHVATIATVVVGRANLAGALRTAIFWGLGHTLTFFAVGLGIVLFGLQFPPELEAAVDIAIATSLLLLGAAQLARAARDQHSHEAPHAARPIILGCMHGLAGSAAVALLALTSIHSEPAALLYLALFGVGTIAGMSLITFMLAWSFRLSTSTAWMRRGLMMTAGAASCLCAVTIFHELMS
ncbi:MAG: Nickel transporter UreH [Myxococcaceae bacterium]|nr:Nickel transporter UreH [Myxococcaceae bacterium]